MGERGAYWGWVLKRGRWCCVSAWVGSVGGGLFYGVLTDNSTVVTHRTSLNVAPFSF